MLELWFEYTQAYLRTKKFQPQPEIWILESKLSIFTKKRYRYPFRKLCDVTVTSYCKINVTFVISYVWALIWVYISLPSDEKISVTSVDPGVFRGLGTLKMGRFWSEWQIVTRWVIIYHQKNFQKFLENFLKKSHFFRFWTPKMGSRS